MNKIGVAVIGAGIGVEHIRTLHDLKEHGYPLDIIGLAKLNPDLNKVISRVGPSVLPVSRVYTDRSAVWDLIKDPRVNMVVIATPDNTHFSYAYPSLNLGNNTFCEKPDVLIEEDGRNLLNLAKETELFYGVLTQQRAHASGLARTIVETSPTRVFINYLMKPSPGKPNPGQNFLPHILSLFYGRNVKVTGFRKDGLADEVSFDVDFNGRPVVIDANMSYAQPGQIPERSATFYREDEKPITKTLQASINPEKGYQEVWFDCVGNPRHNMWLNILRAMLEQDPQRLETAREQEYQRTEAHHRAFFDAVRMGMPISFKQ